MQMSLGLTKALGRQLGSPRGQSRRDGATCVDTLRVLLRRAAQHPDPDICQTDVGSDSVGIWEMRGLVSMSLPRTAHGTASQDLRVGPRKHGHPGLVSGPSALAPVQHTQTHTDTACAGPPQEVGDVGHIPPSLPSGPGVVCEARPPGRQDCWRGTGSDRCAISAWTLGARPPRGSAVFQAWNLQPCGCMVIPSLLLRFTASH